MRRFDREDPDKMSFSYLNPAAAAARTPSERTALWANLGIAAAVLLLVIDAVVCYRCASTLKDNQSWVGHTYDARRRVEQIHAVVAEAVLQQRWALVTGDAAAVADYRASVALTTTLVNDFAAFTHDNSSQVANVAELRRRVDNLFATLGRHATAYRADLPDATKQAMTRETRVTLSSVEDQLNATAAEETRLIPGRQKVVSGSYALLLGSFAAATVVAVGLILLIYFVIARAAQARLRASVEREELDRSNRLLIESTGEGIYGVDLNGCCTFLNAAGAKTLGLNPADVIGKRMHDITHHHKPDGSEYPATECCIYNAYRAGTACRVADEVFFRADGTSFPVEYSAYPIKDGSRTLGAVVTFVDITQRKRDEEAVRESSERFRTLADNIPQLAWMADGKGSIFWYNQRWFDYTGTTLEQMRGFGWKSVHDPDKLESVAAKFADCIKAGTEWEDTFPLRGADGVYRWFLSRAVPIRNEDGRIVRWFGTNTDVTRQREVEAALRQNEETLKVAKDEAENAKEAAEAANVSKSQFLANMSHELRTPLNAVIMYSELLQEEAEDQQIDGFIPDLDKIRTAGKHLLALVNGVLDLSKIEAGKMELYLETFDVEQMVKDVVVTIEPLVMKKNNKMTVEVAAEVGDMHADLTKVRQILFNLLSNASKFTDRGAVTVRVRREAGPTGEMIHFSVADTGIGLTAEQLEKLFQPFTQADASTTRKFGGTGLGLAISKRFAEMMGGTITVTSEIGRGSTFELTVPPRVRKPIEANPIEQSSADPYKGHAKGGTTVKVLVIDDEPSVRDLLSKSLATEHVTTFAAGDGEEGLRMARDVRPDLIFLDVLMPKMDGWAVLTALKADPDLEEVPVVMLTMMTDQEMGYLLGASEYLTKPVDRNRLLSVMKKYKPAANADSVLIVEDDESTRQVLRRTMNREGWTVTEAHNGRVALDRIRAHTPDLVLLDLMMPEMDGFEFLAELRHHVQWQDVPVVVLTSKDLTTDERALLSGKVERILQKGAYSRDALLKEVKKIVDDCAVRGGEPELPAVRGVSAPRPTAVPADASPGGAAPASPGGAAPVLPAGAGGVGTIDLTESPGSDPHAGVPIEAGQV